jgi:hypothetical protein
MTQVQDGVPHSELAFTVIVMKHMAEIGMAFEPVPQPAWVVFKPASRTGRLAGPPDQS